MRLEITNYELRITSCSTNDFLRAIRQLGKLGIPLVLLKKLLKKQTSVKKWDILAVLVFLLLPCLSQAQSPGYQGKRFFVEYHANYMFDFFFRGASQGLTGYQNTVGHKLRHNTSLHYILGRRVSVYAGFDIFRTGLVHDQVFDGKTDNAEFPIIRDVYYRLNTKAYKLGVNLHSRTRKHALVPLGPHFNFSLKYIQTV